MGLATTKKRTRRENDFYPTPTWATEVLIDRVNIGGKIWECCAGANDITKVLRSIPGSIVSTNDIDQSRDTDSHLDLSSPIGWEMLDDRPDWVVTNPPFCHAPGMVPLAYEKAAIGVAMLLRLSFLEPCENRIAFLAEHPPSTLLILPRISFTGDGRTDSTTTAWMVWDKRKTGQAIEIIEKPSRLGGGHALAA